MITENAAPKTVLIVEDDKILSSVLRFNLEKEEYTVVVAEDGAEALAQAREKHPDLIVLDIMLPLLDGLEVCRILRRETKIPIILLTARAEESDRVRGLDSGADDYVTKPFSLRELLARIRALLRRREINEGSPRNSQNPIFIDCLEINTERHQVTLDGVLLSLTPKEYELLLFLVRNRGKVYGREQLLEKVWGYDYNGDTRTVDAHIRNLREKIEEDPANPIFLLTIRGVGYKIKK